jgi:uncharacterized protein (TIGR02646 family)
MKPIATPSEPPCAAAWRENHPTASWKAFKDDNRDPPDGGRGCARELLETLIEAQHGLCAFCEIELATPHALWAQVEHWHPKDPKKYPGHNWGLDFSNMMAGCEGGERDKPETKRSLPPISETRHCGPAKGNDDYTGILLDPRKDVPATPPTWSFNASGEMSVHPDAHPAVSTRAEQTIKLLNLDSRVLRRLRAQLWEDLNRDIDVVWAALGGKEDDFARAFEHLAEEKLRLNGSSLHPFWSTIRCFLDHPAEAWIAANMQVFK